MTTKVDTDESGEIFYSTKVFAVSRPGIKPDEMLEAYKDWTDTYDEVWFL